jgi:hypothetical protein
VNAHAASKIVCDFRKGEFPKTVDIVFEHVQEIASLELFEAGGREILVPVRPARVSRSGAGWVAQFEGWSICRFLRVGEEGTRLTFRLVAPDGGVTAAQAQLVMVLEK